MLARGEQPDLAAFRREHAELVQAYREAGVEVVLMEPDPALPYMVYARDFGACLAEGVLIGSFREPVRQGEELLVRGQAPRARRADRRQGLTAASSRAATSGFSTRPPWRTASWRAPTGRGALRPGDPRAARLHRRGVQLASQNLHLDMAFNIVAPGVAVCAVEQMPEFFLRMLRKRRFELVEVPSAGVSNTIATSRRSATAGCSPSPATAT